MRVSRAVLSFACVVAPAAAQCTLSYQASGATVAYPVDAMVRRPMGQLLVVGNGVFLERNMSGWQALPWTSFGATGLVSASVTDIASGATGDVVATGSFLAIEQVCTYHPYLGSGCSTVWSFERALRALASGAIDYIPANGSHWVESLADGTVVYQIDNYLTDGLVAEPPVPGLLPPPFVSSQLGAADADGGFYALAGADLHRWNGSSWLPPAAAAFDVAPRVLRVLASGDVIAAGDFTTVNGQPAAGVARFDGSSWASLDAAHDGSIADLLELPDGQLVAAGSFTTIAGAPANHIARWDGAAWSAIGSGTDGVINALAWADGALWLGGAFTAAGGVPAANLARLVSSCQATAVASGAGCAGSNGVDMLEPVALPWIDGVFRSRASSLPTTAIAVSAYGLQPVSLPLSVVTPLAPLGCDLLVSPDLLQLGLVTNGTWNEALALTMPTLFVGQPLFHQVVALGLDSGGQVFEWTASNALELTIGAF